MTTTTDLTPLDQLPAEVRQFVPDDLPRSTEAIEVWVARAREQAEAIEINSDEDEEVAAKLVKTYAREMKRFEDERVALTKPRKDAAEYIKRHYDAAKAPFEEADAILREKLQVWLAEKKLRREEAEAWL